MNLNEPQNFWLNVSTDNKMPHADNRYTKLRWLLTITGLFFYVVDIWMDVWLAFKYFQGKYYVWAGLTLGFVLVGLLVTQIFSYAWYRDDMNDVLINSERNAISGISKGELAVIHLFGVGIFTRYDAVDDNDKRAAALTIRRHLLSYVHGFGAK